MSVQEAEKFSHETVEKKVSLARRADRRRHQHRRPGRDRAAVPVQARSPTPAPGVKPYGALELEGRDIYVREGCYDCHSQMIRPLRAETERYGHYSLAGESVYDHPFQFGSKRTGPDLARVGGRYSDDWHRAHLVNPRDVVPESNMPAYPWLAEGHVDERGTARRCARCARVGVPYTDADIAAAAAVVRGKTEMEALIAYLQASGMASAN